MRVISALLALPFLPFLLASSQSNHWSAIAAKSKDGVIKLDTRSYDEILASDRDYSVTIVLTALGPQFKCQPCHDFDPNYRTVANSWKRVPQHERDGHFFASLDFVDGQEVYQRLGLSSAPTMQFHPALTGPNKANKLDMVTYDLNRAGLGAETFHQWVQNLTPRPFELYVPISLIPIILAPILLVTGSIAVYALWPFLLPLIQSRIVWGTVSIIMILTFTSGYMWNKIKNAPYVAIGQNGQTSWIAGGYQNQLGLESQVVAAMYGMLGFTIVALTVFVPAQGNSAKQRIGVYLWLGMLVVIFSLLMKLFKIKNGGYPFSLLF